MRVSVITGQVSSIVRQSITHQVLSGEAKTFGCRTEYEEFIILSFFIKLFALGGVFPRQ